MMDTPSCSTAASVLNRLMRGEAKTQNSTLVTMVVPAAISMHTLTLLCMRPYSRAPKFCPTKVVMATP